MHEPTNKEIMKAVEGQAEGLKQHGESDKFFFKEQKDFNEKQKEFNEAADRSRISIHKRLNEIPTKEDLAKVATKEDIARIEQFLQTVNVGVGAFKFTFNNAGKIGAFLMLLFGIYLFIKMGLVAVIMWARNLGAV